MKTGLLICVCTLTVVTFAAGKTYACNLDPVASLSAYPNPVCVGQSVTLYGSGSSDPDGGNGGLLNGIKKFEWDWTNDGSYDYSESPGDGIATHTYTIAGTYTAKLRVTDNDAAEGGPPDKTDTATRTVYVVKVNSVTVDKTLVCVYENVTFTANPYPSGKALSCIQWQKRYRANSRASWGTWGSASGGDNTAVLNTNTAGLYQYRARNGSGDSWKESSEVKIIDDLTVLPQEAYVSVSGTKEFEAWACVGGSAQDVTAQSTFSTSNGSFSGNTLTASSTPSTSEGTDWVRATYQGNTTDAAHDCDLTVFDVVILYPGDEDEFELSESNYTKTLNITFKARVLPVGVDGTINWTLDLSWDPSPERSGFTSQRTPTSQSNEEHIEVYEEEGGELEVKASATVDGVTCEEKTIIVYIIGDEGGIPNATICTRVKNLYDPDSELSQSEKDKLADLNWTDGICFGIILKESSTMQFYNGAVYNYPDTVRMPYVSDDNTNGTYGDDNDGSHVGLMQVETIKERAWNWLTNTEYGVDLYHSKLHLALGHWQDEKDAHSEATKWTAEQLEDNTSGHYRYGTGRGWYLYWDENEEEWNSEEADESLKNYVDYVRANPC